MNKILTTSISDPSIGQPLTGKSLEFLQNANKESIAGLCEAMVGISYSTSTYYIMSGLTAYGTNQYYAGYVYYNGELFYSAGKSSVTAFTNVPVLTLTVTNDATADPLTFTDNVSRNVHNVRRMVLSDAVSGTGTVDLYLCSYVSIRPLISNDVAAGATVTATSYTTMRSYSLPKNKLTSAGDSIDITAIMTSVRTVSGLYYKLVFGAVDLFGGSVNDSSVNKHSIRCTITRITATSVFVDYYYDHLTNAGALFGSTHDRADFTIPNLDTTNNLIALQGKTDNTSDSIFCNNLNIKLFKI